MTQKLTNPVGTMKTKEVVTLLTHILDTMMNPGADMTDYSQYETTKHYNEKLNEMLRMIENELQAWANFSDENADYVITSFAKGLYDAVLLARMLEPTFTYTMEYDKGNRI